MELDRS